MIKKTLLNIERKIYRRWLTLNNKLALVTLGIYFKLSLFVEIGNVINSTNVFLQTLN